MASIVIASTFLLQANAVEASVFNQKVNTKEQQLSPGVTHIKEAYRTNNVQESVNVLQMNLNDPYTKLEIGIPTPLYQMKRTSVFARENSYLGHRVIGATNAAFYGDTGMPVNLIAKNNVIINYGILGGSYESPTQKPVAFGISQTGAAIADYYATEIQAIPAGQGAITLDGVNRQRAEGSTIVYTSAVSSTKTNQWGVEVVVGQASKSTKNLAFGDRITGKVQSISTIGQAGNAKVPSDGFVISTHNKAVMEQLKNLAIGSELTFSIAIDQKWQNAQYILGAGPLLVKDKQTHISMPTQSSFSKSRHPRTAVGVDATGRRVFLVTVDGRRSGHSNGTSLPDLAQLLIDKGASSAINLDGGGSTTMVTSQPGSYIPQLVNWPSGSSERSVSAILQAVSVAPPGPIESFQVVASSPQLLVGEKTTVEVKNGIDIYSNAYPLNQANVSWQVSGEIGRVEGNQFIASKAGKGTLTATIDGRSVSVPVEVIDNQKEPLSIEGMIQENNWTVATSKAKASLVQTTSKEKEEFSKHSLKLAYDFTTSDVGTKAAYVRLKQPAVLKGRPQSIGLWVNGDGQPNWLRGNVIDGKGQSHTIDFTSDLKLDWEGWRYIEAPLPQNIALPIRFQQVYLVQTKPAYQKKGQIYLSELQAIYSNGFEPSIYYDVVKHHWGYPSIEALNKNGKVKGYPNGTFKPSHALTRAEAASLIARVLDLKTTKPSPFKDVPSQHFAYEHIAAVAEKGIVSGRGEGTFDPNARLTRAEMASILNRAFTLTPTQTAFSPFKDVAKDHWAFDSIEQLVRSGLTSGYPDGTYRPKNATTRAEFAVFINRVMK